MGEVVDMTGKPKPGDGGDEVGVEHFLPLLPEDRAEEAGETDADLVATLAQELDEAFLARMKTFLHQPPQKVK